MIVHIQLLTNDGTILYQIEGNPTHTLDTFFHPISDGPHTINGFSWKPTFPITPPAQKPGDNP